MSVSESILLNFNFLKLKLNKVLFALYIDVCFEGDNDSVFEIVSNTHTHRQTTDYYNPFAHALRVNNYVAVTSI